MTTIQLILALTSIKHPRLHQMDVNNTFLYGDLHEDMYMSLQLGFFSTGPNKAYKLLKSIYGLKEASWQWFEKLS